MGGPPGGQHGDGQWPQHRVPVATILGPVLSAPATATRPCPVSSEVAILRTAGSEAVERRPGPVVSGPVGGKFLPLKLPIVKVGCCYLPSGFNPAVPDFPACQEVSIVRAGAPRCPACQDICPGGAQHSVGVHPPQPAPLGG